MTSLSVRAPKRLRAAATTLAAVLAASVISAVPAAAATGTISGTVKLPSGAEYGSLSVVAWTPEQRYYDADSVSTVAEDGTFELSGLTSGTSYQVSIYDGSGTVSWGYYASGKVVPTASEAALVPTGTSAITMTARLAAPVTDIGIVLPADRYPAWNPAEFVVIEPDTGRVVANASNRTLPASSPGTPLGALPSFKAGARTASARGVFAAAAAAASSQAPVRLDMPTSGLVAGVSYTLAIPVASDSAPSLDDAYFYGGVNRSVTRTLSAAGTFLGGAAKVDVHVMGATAKTAPTISGTVQVGKKLTAKAGTFSMAGTVSYQWLRNGKTISGATGSTYTVRSADHGTKISVRTTLKPATPGYGYAVRSSAQTATVKAGAAPKATSLPKITGTAKVGKKLSASRGTWNLSGLTYSYRWLRDGKDITGATASTYVLTKADAGKKIAVRVTAKRTGYTSGNVRSASTATVAK